MILSAAQHSVLTHKTKCLLAPMRNVPYHKSVKKIIRRYEANRVNSAVQRGGHIARTLKGNNLSNEKEEIVS